MPTHFILGADATLKFPSSLCNLTPFERLLQANTTTVGSIFHELAAFPELFTVLAIPLPLRRLLQAHALVVKPLNGAVRVIAGHHLPKAHPLAVAVHWLCWGPSLRPFWPLLCPAALARDLQFRWLHVRVPSPSWRCEMCTEALLSALWQKQYRGSAELRTAPFSASAMSIDASPGPAGQVCELMPVMTVRPMRKDALLSVLWHGHCWVPHTALFSI